MKAFFCSILYATLGLGCSKSQPEPIHYQFYTGQGPNGGICLWRCDPKTGTVWWTAAGNGQQWHVVYNAQIPDFKTLRPVTGTNPPTP